MLPTDLLTEAQRVMAICNACRYCEGYCAVFPAMELRRSFVKKDLIYLANLCHNCRACYYACQYAPPHEFSLNVPKTFAELRVETYREFTWPSLFSGSFRHNGLSLSLITTASLVIVISLIHVFHGFSGVFSPHVGAGAFYAVIPYPLIVLPISAICLYTFAALALEIFNCWHAMGAKFSEMVGPRANLCASWDVLRLRYLDGGGYGCNYPYEQFSYTKRWFHHLVFYGFILCIFSTTVAAAYHHLLHRDAPYPFWSWPVMLGTAGGVALLIGTGGLLYLKWRMDAAPAAARSLGIDVGFLVLLFLTSLTGLILMVLRETPAMGTLLAVHLAFVVALFITLPYGKFVHALYRYAALVRYSIEQSQQAD